MRILFFGDSITHGFFDKAGGWAMRLINDYHNNSLVNIDEEKAWVEAFNLGISGDALGGVIARFENEVSARQLYADENAFVFAIGMNDTVVNQNGAASSPEKFARDLLVLYEKTKKLSTKVLFVGLSAVDDNLCNPWKYSSSKKCFQNSRIKEFNKVLEDFCVENKIAFVAVFEDFQSRQTKDSLLSDGLHPNDKGHELLASLVKPRLDELLSQ